MIRKNAAQNLIRIGKRLHIQETTTDQNKDKK